ncbi:hypothetical protein B0H34DRAFT_75916 [Crassisporium funariophilum]|nr:hypothetical protein B0H34DRAFT_75916 [Crassisporium funariophilum]
MKANENPPPPVRGGNQRPVGGPPQHGPQITSSWSDNFKFANAVKKNIPRSNVIKMCDVCHVRPRCQKQGKIYPTCGLSCAAKMHPPGTIEMCDYCKQRPKIIINGKVYPQCGKTCRDKAKSAATADDAAACTTCIICWKASKHSPNSDFCSKGCESVAQCKAPFLIELPRGHVSFKKVADTFISAWNTPKRPCPVVKKVYMVVVKSSVHATYDNYRTRVGSNGLFAKKGNERKRWLGTTRECGFGNSGDLEPCSSNKCLLCCVVRSKVDRQFFPDGITTTSSLPRAVETSENSKRKLSSKVVMLTNVLLGREVEMSRDELIQPLPPRGSDSVRVVSFRGFGGKVDQGEIVVYDGDAVKPLYLIVYG